MTGAVAAPARLRLRDSQLFSGAIFIFVLLALAVLWFFLVHSVRIKELRYRLKATTDQNGSVRTMSLVSRYQMLRQSALNGENAANYAREGRVMQILAETTYLNETDELNAGEQAAKVTVDFFDFVSGSSPFRHERSSREYRIIERAFYHEITRTYREAIVQYDAALNLTERVTGDMRAYTLLHRGFCKALANDRLKAAQDWREVLGMEVDPEYHETAKILLSMVGDIDRELMKIDAMPVSKQKGAAYYSLTAYDQAIDNFKKMPATQTDPEALFYYGRALEETGNSKLAVEQYRKAIATNAGTAWAIKANRRIFALGAFYAAGKEYRTESKSNVEKGIIADQALLKEAERFTKVSEQIDKGERATVAAILENPEPLPEPMFSIRDMTKDALAQTSERATETVRVAQERKGPDWAALELLPRAEKIDFISKQPKIERIELEDGNQFRGVVMSESRTRVFLFTALGRVAIIKSQIEARETVAP